MYDFIYFVRTLDGNVLKVTICPDDAKKCARAAALRTCGEPIWVEQYTKACMLNEDEEPPVVFKALYPTMSQRDDKEHTFVFPDETKSN